MQLNLGNLLQMALLILIIAAVAAVIQVIIILVDVRQITKSIRKSLSAIKLLDYFLDGEEMKKRFKQCRKACFNILESIFKLVQKLLGR